MMKKILIFIALLSIGNVFSQDIKGAYIRTQRVSGFTYSTSVTLFTDPALNISRPTVTVNFGDASVGTLTLTSINNSNGSNIKTYTATHLYPGAGAYILSYLDQYRVSGIKNIQNSQSQQIYIEAVLNLINLPNSSSPLISNYPLNFGVIGSQIVYNPSCYDNDADSISYSLVNCAPSSYYLPTNASINNATGTFSFSKDSIGIYAFCIKIQEWKKNTSNMYVAIGSSQIDFVIDITTTIGIRELNFENFDVSIYPNPILNELNINISNLATKSIDLSIINFLGQVILKKENFESSKINVSFLASGIYYIHLRSESKQKTFKIIKE